MPATREIEAFPTAELFCRFTHAKVEEKAACAVLR